MAVATEHRALPRRGDLVVRARPRAGARSQAGRVVTFETNDCFTGQIRSEDDLVTDDRLRADQRATGPVAVVGAEPGDSLVAEILDVRPVEWGVATLIPGFGQLIDQVQAPLTRLFEVADGDDPR